MIPGFIPSATANQVEPFALGYGVRLRGSSSGAGTITPASDGAVTFIGGSASGGNLTLQSTSHATRGAIKLIDRITVGGTTVNTVNSINAAASIAGILYADSTTYEHRLIMSSPTAPSDQWGGNVLSLQHTHSQGVSGVRFIDLAGDEHGAVGYGNTGLLGVAPAFSGATFIESADLTASHVTAPPPVRVVQTGYLAGVWGNYPRFGCDSTGAFAVYTLATGAPSGNLFGVATTGETTVTASLVGDAMIVRQNNASGYSTAAFKDNAGASRCVVGYGLSGAAATYASTAYLATVGGSSTRIPFKLVQHDGTTAHVPFSLGTNGAAAFDSSGTLAITTAVVGDAVVIRQNTTSGYSTAAFKDQAGATRCVVGYGLSAAAAAYASTGYLVTIGGSGTRIPFKILQADGSTDHVGLEIDVSGNFTIGEAALATNATAGFLYIPSCAGTPSGTPTSKTGRVPIIYDSTNDKVYVYRGGWKATAALT